MSKRRAMYLFILKSKPLTQTTHASCNFPAQYEKLYGGGVEKLTVKTLLSSTSPKASRMERENYIKRV